MVSRGARGPLSSASVRYNVCRMNDLQILTLAVAVVVPFFGVTLGVLLNNSRLNDVNNRILDMKEILRAEIQAERADRRAENADLRILFEKHHSEIMAKLIEMDNRIVRLEAQRLIQ